MGSHPSLPEAFLRLVSPTNGKRSAERLLLETGQPNKRLELTPLRVERDRADFESWFPLGCPPDLSVQRSSAARRWAERREFP
jgi:hypothetical protein